MRLLLIAFLFAISYAQTDAATSPAPIVQALASACTFKCGQIVESGWRGQGFGDEHCNQCMCNDGILMCTLMICQTTTTTDAPTLSGCTLTGGEPVAHAWTGQDTGANSCNNCICSNGALMCTRKGCPAEDTGSITIIPVIQPPSGDSVASAPLSTEKPLPTTGPDFTKMDKSTCGGKTENMCHTLPLDQCIAEPCCKVLGVPPGLTKCRSVTKVVHPIRGLECGDFDMSRCQKDAACLWNEIEQECDELKEMDCQDLPEAHCNSAIMCTWVFDEVRYSCKETKEIESIGLKPAHGLQNGHAKLRNAQGAKSNNRADSQRRQKYSTVVAVGIIFGCMLSTLISQLYRKSVTPELHEDLTLGSLERRV